MILLLYKACSNWDRHSSSQNVSASLNDFHASIDFVSPCIPCNFSILLISCPPLIKLLSAKLSRIVYRPLSTQLFCKPNKKGVTKTQWTRFLKTSNYGHKSTLIKSPKYYVPWSDFPLKSFLFLLFTTEHLTELQLLIFTFHLLISSQLIRTQIN